MRQFSRVLIGASFFILSCNSQEHNKATEGDPGTEKVSSLPPASKLNDLGTQQLMAVVANYYQLKDALVATNAAKADEAAGKLVVSADTMNAYLTTDSMNRMALQPYLDTIVISSKLILSLKDETTEQKRIHFEHVSDAMFGLLKTAELKNAGVYRQYCPMAFNDKGAYWLSNEEEIKNPYFGKKMLECGEVTDSLN